MKHIRLFLWFSLVANIVLLACLAWLIIKPPKPSLGSIVANALEMNAGYENGSLILLLDKEYDRNASFKLFDKDQELMISKDDMLSANENGIKSIGITLGTELELACVYISDSKPSFRELRLMLGDRILEDLNADGQYDLRTWLRSEKMSNGHTAIDVWFNNEWHEVIGGVEKEYKSVNTLKDDLKVNFDRTTGRWVTMTPSDQE